MLPMKPVAELLKERAAVLEVDQDVEYRENYLIFGLEMSVLTVIGSEAYTICTEEFDDVTKHPDAPAIEEWFLSEPPPVEQRQLEADTLLELWKVSVYEDVVLRGVSGIYRCIVLGGSGEGGSADQLFFALERPIIAG